MIRLNVSGCIYTHLHLYILQSLLFEKENTSHNIMYIYTISTQICELTFKFTSWAKWISVALDKTNVTVLKKNTQSWLQ